MIVLLVQLLLPIALTLLGYTIFHALHFLYHELTSPLRFVAGPSNSSIVFGNSKEMVGFFSFSTATIANWRKEFGGTLRDFGGFRLISELETQDLKALSHIFANPHVYMKAFGNVGTEQLLGKGLVSVELGPHQQQRRLLNPAFGTAQIRLLMEVFVEKSIQVRDIWARQIDSAQGTDRTTRIDVCSWLRRAALDIIGEAGFNHHFNTLDEGGSPDELDEALTELFHSPRSHRLMFIMQAQSRVRILRHLPIPGAGVRDRAREKMLSIGKKIVERNLAAMKEDGQTALGGKRDLLSVLLKANLSPDVPESQRLTEHEVIAQIPTFLFAGHETSSSAVTWALHALSLNPGVQTKLRDELFTLATDNPSMDELNSLPYLESVVRETMRVHSPVPSIQRQAVRDDVLPLSTPYIDREGREHESLPIPKGQIMSIPILAVNTSEEIWGADAKVFRPERWDRIPETTNSVPGVWAHLMTFFAGPHHCIGFRFSLVEIKALLFVLLRAFEFEPAVAKEEIIPSILGLMRPVVGGLDKGSSLPLIVKRHRARDD
ncbi:cytochrome P450 [Roridomyces roridus]|uniref:Cytochrome P450 n=1 Tax=Roridomyces roridus TaxID=1738132 RepID=A0AAD7B3B8_9AGAR|nr:cytochrome P450 [Roridomyces roridus]